MTWAVILFNWAALAVLLWQVRQLRRHAHHAHLTAEATSTVTIELMRRASAWLNCDRCGGRLDTDGTWGAHNTDTGIVLLCGGCRDD